MDHNGMSYSKVYTLNSTKAIKNKYYLSTKTKAAVEGSWMMRLYGT